MEVITLESQTIGTWLPVFPGFYNTAFDLNESFYHEEHELGVDTYTETISDYLDFGAYKQRVANKAATTVQGWLERELEVHLHLTNVYVHSPKYYNFSNDAIYVDVELSPEARLAIGNYITARKSDVASYIKQLYTSRSGFNSHYSNNYEDWDEITSGFTDFDHKDGDHMLGRALDIVLQLSPDSTDSLDLYYATEVSPHEFLEYPESDPENVFTIHEAVGRYRDIYDGPYSDESRIYEINQMLSEDEELLKQHIECYPQNEDKLRRQFETGREYLIEKRDEAIRELSKELSCVIKHDTEEDKIWCKGGSLRYHVNHLYSGYN